MRAASQALRDHLAANNFLQIADLVTLTIGASSYRWTTSDTDIVHGGNTYAANGPIIGEGTARLTSSLEVDTFDVELGTGGGIPIAGKALALACVDGALDGATLTVDRVYMATWGDTSLGLRRIFTGRVAAVEPLSTAVRVTIKSAIERLNYRTPRRKIEPSCPLALYSADCGASKAANTHARTVAAGSTKLVVNVTVAPPAGITAVWWIEGTSGANIGQRRQISSVSGSAITLDAPLPYLPVAGDGISIVKGCERNRTACIGFSNLARFQGYADAPTKEA